jgi:hypothetical protein
MKKALVTSFFITIACLSVFCQSNKNAVKKPSLGLHFLLNDFNTAINIRSTSLNAVIRDKKASKIKDMSPGIALSYVKGIHNLLDFSTSLSASFVDYPFEGRSNSGSETLLLEADASVHAKLSPDNYVVNPYLSIGAGISKFKGYYGAFLPTGAGLQFNLFNEAFFMINAQYRIKVSDNTNYHFYYSIGFVGNL